MIQFAVTLMCLCTCFVQNALAIVTDTHACDCYTVWNKCGRECEVTCKNKEDPPICHYDTCLGPGACICKENLARNDLGNCIPHDQCPHAFCNCPYSVWNKCGKVCEITCENRDDPPVCNFNTCEGPGACVCRDGLVRNDLGKCVPPKICPHPTCNETFTEWNICGKECEVTCANKRNPPDCDFDSCKGPGACNCIDDYVRNATGSCILPRNCPPPACSCPLKVWNICGYECELTCDNYEDPPICDYDTCDGPGACICRDNLVKNDAGHCISQRDCPHTCTNPRKIWNKCGQECELTCANKDNPPICHFDICEGPGACICKDGLVSNSMGICIHPDNCPPPTCSSPFKIWNKCGTECEITCDNYENPPACNYDTCQGPGACICKTGWVKNINGNCILSRDCPHTCENPMKIWNKCGPECEITCANKDNPPICHYDTCNGPGACICKDGLVNDSTGTCIQPESCPPPTCSYPLKIWDKCGYECELTCDNYENPPVCNYDTCSGPGSCICKNDLVKNEFGNCISPNDCPHDCENPLEIWNICGHECETTYLNKHNPPICNYNTCHGPGACICKNDLVRDMFGDCVPPNKCPHECTDLLTVYSPCGEECEITCHNKRHPPICDEDICIGPGSCICADGYVRNGKGNCIEPNKCRRKCLKPHTVFSPCGKECDVTCANMYNPPICETRTCEGPGACVCAEGFVRNNKNKCIPPIKCFQNEISWSNEFIWSDSFPWEESYSDIALSGSMEQANFIYTLKSCVKQCLRSKGFNNLDTFGKFRVKIERI